VFSLHKKMQNNKIFGTVLFFHRDSASFNACQWLISRSTDYIWLFHPSYAKVYNISYS